MKNVYKIVMAVHTFLYRLTRGRIGGKMFGFKVLLLTTKVRRSGQLRTAPLGYIEDSGTYVICASNGGSDTHPAWYHNIKSNPQVTIEVKEKRIPATAQITTGEERLRLWNALVAEAPNYAEYAKSTTREIPMVVLRPVNQFG